MVHVERSSPFRVFKLNFSDEVPARRRDSAGKSYPAMHGVRQVQECRVNSAPPSSVFNSDIADIAFNSFNRRWRFYMHQYGGGSVLSPAGELSSGDNATQRKRILRRTNSVAAPSKRQINEPACSAPL
ncbi:hypothetical protein KCP75_05590 [Salmonella enterica subsp. enterica]|nr:hypothetical protein KCP75_05590 [Salmonella enterica subsp. enterica]